MLFRLWILAYLKLVLAMFSLFSSMLCSFLLIGSTLFVTKDHKLISLVDLVPLFTFEDEITTNPWNYYYFYEKVVKILN